jgi:hypothetical protein
MNTISYLRECIKRKEFYLSWLLINIAVDAIVVYLALKYE